MIAALTGWIALSGTLLWLRRSAVRSVWFYASRSYEGAHYDPELRALLLFTGAAWIALCAILGNRFTASLLRPTFCAPQLNRSVLKPRPSRTRHPAR